MPGICLSCDYEVLATDAERIGRTEGAPCHAETWTPIVDREGHHHGCCWDGRFPRRADLRTDDVAVGEEIALGRLPVSAEPHQPTLFPQGFDDG